MSAELKTKGFMTAEQFKAVKTVLFPYGSLQTTCFSRKQITDERLEQLGQRFTANPTFQLMGLTFAEYLESPDQYDRIAKDMANGGKCRVIAGALVPSHG